MWVKICGTTNLSDALLAVGAGADAVGFVFGPSKRQVTTEQAGKITRELPARIEKIGVLVNESPERIEEIVQTAGLTGVQLQGDESPELVAELRRLNLRFLAKTIHAMADPEKLAQTISKYSGFVDTVLLDSGNPAERGGTGKRFDWEIAGRELAKVSGVRVIVAGGLNVGNVGDAIAMLRPWGVDVVTGVESEPGKKDPEKVRAFIAAARAAASER
ncbi:MAG TPA: phosphoribosylanthranilate isomerase [Terriglobales bacterium]